MEMWKGILSAHKETNFIQNKKAKNVSLLSGLDVQELHQLDGLFLVHHLPGHQGQVILTISFYSR